MNRPGRLLLAGALAVLAAVSLPASQARERVLYVSVFQSESREPVTGLPATAFEVREDGVAREVLRVTPATSPMPVALLVDNSAPTASAIPDIRKALTAFVRAVDGLGPVALVGVADRPTILVDYTTSQEELLRGVNRIFAVPTSGARLLDGIVEVARGAARRESDRAAIVALATEHVEFSDLHYQQVLDPLADSGASFSAVVLQNLNTSLTDTPARNRAVVLDRAPRQAGGVRMEVLTSMAFEERLVEVARILKSQYRLVYARPATLIPPERLEVTVTQPGLTARAAPARGQESP